MIFLQECQTRYEQQCQTTYEQECQTTYEEVCEESLPQYTSYGAPTGYGAPKQCKQVNYLDPILELRKFIMVMSEKCNLISIIIKYYVGAKTRVQKCSKARVPECSKTRMPECP